MMRSSLRRIASSVFPTNSSSSSFALLAASNNNGLMIRQQQQQQQSSIIQSTSRCWFTNSSSSSSAAVAAASPKLAATLQSELQYEKSNYEPAANISSFLEKSGWTLTEKDGDINMVLKKKIRDLSATIEFQLVSPSYSGEGEEEEGNQIEPQETTDFSVTVEKPKGNGAVFFCTTVGNDEKYRFMVGNVRYFETAEEKSSVSGYNGPEFEDLDDNMQTGVDEWLSSLGINEEMCDFIDAMAVDKEQREYMRWLNKIAEIVE